MEILERVSVELNNTVHCTLIGGLAMIHHGAKETTKDIDIVFKWKHEIEYFIQALEKMGFNKKYDLSDDYLDLAPHSVYISQEGFMFDMFLNRVLDGFYLTDEMMERCREIHLKGNLHFTLLSPVDIFLFKSITLRDGDLLDMAFLAPMIKDWDAYQNELHSPVIPEELVSRSYLRIQDLFNEHQIKIPIDGATEEFCEMATAKTVILGAIQYEPKEKEFLFEGSTPSERYQLEQAIEQLVFDGVIFDENGIISLKTYGRE